jgi:hypothetical protein
MVFFAHSIAAINRPGAERCPSTKSVQLFTFKKGPLPVILQRAFVKSSEDIPKRMCNTILPLLVLFLTAEELRKGNGYSIALLNQAAW